jgi:hypothetical protein
MKWFVLVVFINIVAVAFYYLSRRRQRRHVPESDIDSNSGANFYPEIEKCHEINTRNITCSCEDFRKEREQFRHDDPRRLCKHLVRSFVDAGSLPEELVLYKRGIERSAEAHNGFPACGKRFDKVLGGKKVSIMIPKEVCEKGAVIDVYCEGGRYGYSPESGNWIAKAPPREGQILMFLHEKLGKPVPGEMEKLSGGAAEDSGKDRGVAEEEPERFMIIGSFLKSVLPVEHIAFKETKNYVAVTINDSRKWICRLHLNSKKSRYIEFPDGTRCEFSVPEDIMKYRERLLTAYGERAAGKAKRRVLFQGKRSDASSLDLLPVESRDDTSFFSRN